MAGSSGGGISRRDFLRQAAAGAMAAAGMGSDLAAAGAGTDPGPASSGAQSAVQLPEGVSAVWDLVKAFQEQTPTRASVCINGLWRWQPAAGEAAQQAAPTGNWGYFKVPGCWPGIGDYMQKDCQTVHAHPSWSDQKLGEVTAAWYQREITIPSGWAGRRIALAVECLNSYAAVYLDGQQVGEIRFPSGEVDLTAYCVPGRTYLLSLQVVALPLRGVMLSYSDTNAAKQVAGSVERRGLVGDVFLVGTPKGARIEEVRVDTSVRKKAITVTTALTGLAANAEYTLHAKVLEKGRVVHTMQTAPFPAADLKNGHFVFTDAWLAKKLWDIHTPENTYELSVSLQSAGKVADTALTVRFGYREFWIDGKDFYLNGTRLFISCVPADNAGVSAYMSSYAPARESFERLKGMGINFVYGHNYGCEPGSHLQFEELLRAADDVGMLFALSQPHFGHYDWEAEDADRNNGYARHAAFYVHVAGSHPSVVAYSTSHNGCGYNDDMNPDMIDGRQRPANQWSDRNAARAMRAQAIIESLDPARIVYHHSSGNLGAMHTSNFYPNWAPAQELSDWLEHWATVGVKPFFTVEYSAPMTWDWTMYRGWYKGERTFGSAVVPWEFCQAEWSAQCLGDRAYKITEPEKVNLRWEAAQFRAGKLWYRWDYPNQVGAKVFDDQHEICGRYTEDNWRAYRTWGMSGNSPWDSAFYWRLKPGVNRARRELVVDWGNLQRPGFSADYIGEQYERMDMAYQLSDWEATADGQALLRNNQPLLAYIAGKPARFTSKDHNFYPGETIEKQLVIINNSRQAVSCEWSLNPPRPIESGSGRVVVPTGDQARVEIRCALPPALEPGTYELTATARFDSGESQTDSFVIHVMPHPPAVRANATIALFDPKGETGALLAAMGLPCRPVGADDDLSPYQVLVIGKGALTVDGPGPNLARVRQGLKVILFEQTSEALEKRLGFRVAEYGLRQVFPRVPGHRLLQGLGEEHLRDWRGEATLTPPRLKYTNNDDVFNGANVVKWCDIPVTRVWRCGNRGNLASVLIEKPARGDFLPLLDGGFGLQYSPLLEYREGEGMILFCQMDVTARSENDPAAETLVHSILDYVSSWQPSPNREAVYAGDPAGRTYLEAAGLEVRPYQRGPLSSGQALIVGPGGGAQLAASAPAIASWLKSGGHLLAIGLDEAEANAFLPFRVSMKREEHIAAQFGRADVDLPLTGVGCADTLIRDPRELPLLTGGASAVGDGVLAVGGDGNVVFCQLAPWQFEYRRPDAPSAPAIETLKMNLKRTYRRTSVLLARLLGNMGVAGSTPLVGRFGQPLTPASPDKRWLEGLYLDQPEEWDDPYRFFRW